MTKAELVSCVFLGDSIDNTFKSGTSQQSINEVSRRLIISHRIRCDTICDTLEYISISLRFQRSGEFRSDRIHNLDHRIGICLLLSGFNLSLRHLDIQSLLSLLTLTLQSSLLNSIQNSLHILLSLLCCLLLSISLTINLALDFQLTQASSR